MEDIMAIVRWDPFRDFDELFSRPLLGTLGRMPRVPTDEAVEWTPTVDVSETDKEYVVKAELPAVKKEDVKVLLDDNVLTIRGERRYEKEHADEKIHRKESFHGTFSRSLVLPENVDPAAIRAESKDGVLTVRIPKKLAPQPKAIEINVH
jgi:HSP20 family protein